MSYPFPQQPQSAIPNRLSSTQAKMPQVNYPEFNDQSVDFQFQAFKLIQANTILTQLIKKAINDKYSISQRIIKVNEQIKKLQAKNNK